MSAQEDGDGIDEVAGFAALLRELKERTDRSYGSLARRLGMNTSTLHRYCAGDAVPLDFAPVERFAALCGATSEQRLDLHRRWLAAVAARRRPRTAEAAVSAPGAAASAAEPAPNATGGSAVVMDPAPGPPGAPAPPHRTWYRHRRLAVGLASVCAVLATLGTLSALPDGTRSSADGPVRGAGTGPTASGTAEAGSAEGRDASSSPSRSPASSGASERPSGSTTPKEKPATSRPPGATSAPPRGGQPAGPPLAWSVNSQAWKLGCGHDYVIAKPPGEVPPPPAPQDAAPWAATQSAVHGGETLVQLSVQGRSDTAVVLEALRVRVVGRTAPAEGNAYAMDQGCGGSITPRYFAVDLDKDRPIARAVAGNDSGTPIPAVRMPYRVSAKDPEVLLVTAGTSTCNCRWYLELDWSSQGRTGTVRVDDDGRPFRTSAIEGLPRYMYDTLERRWGPYG
ncbi:helix-turn-helix domain-containing protein [Streptomyces violaceorubidus]|uniref:helix-turn-helix domain-containing protein n=1 Tax=Streptomyces violaceorubidus TaxID=284042 RepID=UPI0004C20F02|nr:helix-turn-helix transcriptional regulator [Streptomyces violaceorubidus]